VYGTSNHDLCHGCQNSHIVRSGSRKYGKPQYHLAPTRTGAQVSLTLSRRQNRIRRCYHERATMRGLEHIFRVIPQTVVSWIKTCMGIRPHLKGTLLSVDLRMCWKWMKCGLSKKDHQRGLLKKPWLRGQGKQREDADGALGQRLARFVTLKLCSALSRTPTIKWLIAEYNLAILSLTFNQDPRSVTI